MPWSALPDHIDEPHEWAGTDWDNRFQRWMLKFKGWFAYGPRATEWWANWREYPLTIFAVFGKGLVRWENTDASNEVVLGVPRAITWFSPWTLYLSAIQYWSRWHFQLQWPLFIAFHFYIDEPPVHPARATTQRVFYFRIGARRDSDRVYWFPSMFIGLNWN